MTDIVFNDSFRSTEYAPSDLARRLILLLIAVCFIALYQWTYINFLSVRFDYYGFEYYKSSARYLPLSWVLSLLPILWMPICITRPSQLLVWMIYLIVYMPSMFIPLLACLDGPGEICKLMFVLFLGFLPISLIHRLPLIPVKFIRIRRDRFWWGFWLLWIMAACWVLIAFHKTFSLANFDDIYEVRFDAGDIMKNSFVNYALMWLYGALDPFLMGYGLFRKKRWMFVVGLLGQILVYGSYGNKASLLSIVLVITFYVLFRIGRPFGLVLLGGALGVFAVLALLYKFSGEEFGAIVAMVAFLVVFRLFGAAGLLTGQYYHFVKTNPYTFYSHLSGINWLVHYPYKVPLGTEVGYFYYFPLNDATAHFWATDGIMAAGLPGIILVSVVCALVFWLIDSAAVNHDARLGALVLSYAVFSLANLSLFTTLLSGGLGLVTILLYLMPSKSLTSPDTSLVQLGKQVSS